ncbi:MAG: DUF167 domain-containing protein [Nitrospirae bacterium]|nr:DUF167 domain-containing protein [Nitrospirota bacterium]
MNISVKVKPGSKKEDIERVDDSNFIAHVKAPPIEGKANDALVRLLSKYFGVPKNHIQIIKGTTGKYKLVEIVGRVK